MIGLVSSILLAGAQPVATPPRLRCTEERAERTTVAQVMTDQAAWVGRCVAIRGITQATLLFDGVEGFYRAGPLVGGGGPDRIALDNVRIIRRIPRLLFTEVVAIGVIVDCEGVAASVLADAPPDQIVFIGGVCHYEEGAILYLTDVRIRRYTRERRRMGEAARAAYGTLEAAPSTWPRRRYALERAAEFLAAVRTGDRSAFNALHGGMWNRSLTREAVRTVFGAGSPFAGLPPNPQSEILVERAELEDDQSDPQQIPMTICFCRGPDCTDSWPISTTDTDNRGDRPYACTRLTPYLMDGRTMQIFITGRGEWGLREPRSTAFRR